jgi:Protein of unknown function (DUF3592)
MWKSEAVDQRQAQNQILGLCRALLYRDAIIDRTLRDKPERYQSMVSIILRGTIYDWYSIPFILAFAGVMVAASYWRFFVQWLNGIRGRDWPAVSAIIDIVSVVRQTEQTGKGEIVSYLAMLTYFYRNPELQTGDYSRLFNSDEEADAQAWAASYKGCTVTVHVDPRDPSHSVLRKEEL